jgi:hypothetical protein
MDISSLGATAEIRPYYLAVDPGKGSRRTIGVFAWSEKPEPVHKGQYTKEQYDAYRDNLEKLGRLPELIILESYTVLSAKKNMGSKMETAQLIGVTKEFARRHRIPVVEQPSSILPTAHLWAGIPKPKGHLPDWQSAYLHGYYYLVRHGIMPPRVLERVKNGKQ